MDYEKAYKEALKRAKKIYDNAKELRCVVEAVNIETIFPELNESEDEKIRKALINGVECCKASGWTNFGNNVDIDVVLAWLEKQGINYSLVEEIKKRKDSFMREKEKAVSSNDKLSLGARIAMLEELLVFVKEKQGERKASNVDYFQVDDEVGNLNDWVITTSHDKVEPKFKVGDYIVYDYCMGRVVEITNDAYLLDIGQGIPFSCQSTRLWDITKDAKKGDVLHSIGFHNDCIFIFNGLDNDGYREVATGYCCLFISADKIEFGIQGPDGIEIDTVKPATKIQRDLLFQKMKEAGYEWNDSTKELKKINSYCQENCKGYQETGKCFADGGCDAKRKAEQESAEWSEEDENRFQNIIACIEDCYNEKDAQDLIRWFKYLRHQPKPVWSKADIKMLELIIDGYQNTEDFSKVDGVFVDWLKSLKDRMEGKED